ncbi:GlxA family transcriptional regulator [Roseibium sp. Sym1]|uniref:GlxA family transcriptional regulator n=1 Tax=Roseibium sp. Sym1 TaxID=3016006 RepID=UPI0022B50262|nr:helix-turn-helix domain-containing protein [Roseibium sp. Sym1]
MSLDRNADDRLTVEIFIQPGFSELELSSVIAVLRAANEILSRDRFSWQVTSDSPGFVNSRSELIARADPTIGDQFLRDCLFVVAGTGAPREGWMRRLRAMQKLQRRVVLLSEASREYVKASNLEDGSATAHWRDAALLREVGNGPALSDHLAQEKGSIVTCAGEGYTVEAVIGVLADVLEAWECAEIASLLVVENVRGFAHPQPRGMSDNTNLFEKRLQKVVQLMEHNIEVPLRLADLASQVGLSPRHLERLFTVYLNTTPARFYKKIRLKKAHTLVTGTHISLIEIALASGFLTAPSFSQAYKAEYGETPTQIRRKRMGA